MPVESEAADTGDHQDRPGHSHGHQDRQRACAQPAGWSGWVPASTPPPADPAEMVLRGHLRRAFARELAAAPDPGRRAGAAARRRAWARTLLAESAETHNRQLVAAGRGPVAPTVERRVIERILDETFGVAPLLDLLAEPFVREVTVTAARTVLRYANGQRADRPPLVRDDTDLSRLLDAVAARAGQPLGPGLVSRFLLDDMTTVTGVAEPFLELCRRAPAPPTFTDLAGEITVGAGWPALLSAPASRWSSAAASGPAPPGCSASSPEQSPRASGSRRWNRPANSTWPGSCPARTWSRSLPIPPSRPGRTWPTWCVSRGPCTPDRLVLGDLEGGELAAALQHARRNHPRTPVRSRDERPVRRAEPTSRPGPPRPSGQPAARKRPGRALVHSPASWVISPATTV
jgi:hypothetical protein